MLAAYVHTIDPYFIKLWEGGPIRWYGLSYLLGFLIGYLLIRRVVRAGLSTLSPQRAGDYVVVLAIGIVVGGRLGYALFYEPSLLWRFDGGFPWWGLLKMHQGGMASHGGMLGLIVASYYYAHRHGHRWTHLLDLGAFAAPLGLFFGRIANFINAELIGRPVPEGSIAMRWAVKYPEEMWSWSDARIAELAAGWHRLGLEPPANVNALIAQTIHKLQRGNEAMHELVAPMLTAVHPSQLYAAVLEGLVTFTVLLWLWRRPRKPMLIGGAFCVTYAVMRIVNEFFRQPDAHLGLRLFGLTRGQWLSVALLALGVTLLVIFARRKVEPMGGWRGRS